MENKKALGLLTLAGLLVIASLWSIAEPFTAERNIFYWFWVGLLIIITAISLSFSILFPSGRKAFIWVAALCSLSILAFFPLAALQVAAAFIFFCSLILTSRSIVRTEKESLHFSFYRSVHRGQTLFFVGVIILLSLNSYIATAKTLGQDPEGFYESMAGKITSSVETVLNQKVRGFSPDMTLDEFLTSSSFFDEPKPTSSIRPEQQLAAARDNFLRTVGVEASGDEEIMRVLHRVVTLRLESVFKPIQSLLPAIYALFLFLSLRLVVPVLVWLAAAGGSVLFKLALKINFIKMSAKNVSVEVPELT